MIDHPSPPERHPWLRLWIYLAHGLLVVAFAVLLVIAIKMPATDENYDLVRVGLYFIGAIIATSLSVNDDLRYRIWRNRQRRWPPS